MNVKKLKLMHPMIQAYRYLHHLQAEILTSLSLIALIFCRQISGYFADYNKDIWFAYFITVERFSMLLLLLSTHSYLKNKCWIILELLLFFLVQDFIDRYTIFIDYSICTKKLFSANSANNKTKSDSS